MQLKPRSPPETISEPRGFIAEPDVIERAAIFSDRRFGTGELVVDGDSDSLS